MGVQSAPTRAESMRSSGCGSGEGAGSMRAGEREFREGSVRPRAHFPHDAIDASGITHAEGEGAAVLGSEGDADLIAGIDGLAEAEARPAVIEPAVAERLQDRGDGPAPDGRATDQRPGEAELAGELGAVDGVRHGGGIVLVIEEGDHPPLARFRCGHALPPHREG